MTTTRRRSATPKSAPPYSPLSDDDVYLFNEGTHRQLGDKLGAHLRPGGGVAFGVWAPNAVRVAVVGDFNHWSRDSDLLAPRGSSGVWEGVVDRAEAGNVYKFAITTRAGEVLEKADPFARCTECPPRTGSVVWDLAYEWGDGDWMRSRGDRVRLECPALGLRGPPGQLAARSRRTVAVPRVRRGGAAADRPRAAGRVLPCGVPPADGASLLRVVGLPGHRVLRAHPPLRGPPGAHVPDRPAPPGRDRGHPRLGAVALSRGCLRAGPVRRHVPLRARRPPPRLPPGLEEPDLQLRAPRGAELSGLVGRALAVGLPRRRAAGRRGGLHALPRLLPQTRRVDTQRPRGAREPRGPRLPPPAEHRDLRRPSRRPGHRRGVHRLPRRLAAGRCRGRRVRAQVGHGLDARHAAVPRTRSGVPAPPPRRAHLPQHVRLQRELHAPPLARRGGARQGVAAHQDARRRLAAVRQPPPAVRLSVRAAGEEAALHGGRAGAAARVGPRHEPRLASPRQPGPRRDPALGVRSQPSLPGTACAARPRLRAGRLRLDAGRRVRDQPAQLPPTVAGGSTRPGRLQLHPGATDRGA